MVKFLLFKSRKIIQEGMNMERIRGNLSFDPGRMDLRYWGSGDNPFWKLCDESLIAQNILLACYNDRCTAEEISLQTGVAVPYLESDLKSCASMMSWFARVGDMKRRLLSLPSIFLWKQTKKHYSINKI
jgi:hypothetical protein